MASIIKADTLQSTTANVFFQNSAGTEYARFDSTGVFQLANNLTFTGTGNRITGDTNNATVSNRLFFQSSTTNGSTSFGVLPNGTSLVSGYQAYNNSDPTNAAFIQMATSAGTDARVTSGITGTGTYLPITFYTGGSERMRIDTSGNLLVAGTFFNANGSVCIGPIGTGTNGCTAVSASSSATNIWRFYNTNGNIGTISISGSATTYSTSSDYRLKNTISPMTGALAKVALLKPCTYKWNADGSDGQGFIAHELQEVVEGCVTGTKDAVETYTDEDGNEATRPIYQGIDTSFLVATLTAAIQEQQALITQLQADVAALKAK
jgi:hypothetical protein